MHFKVRNLEPTKVGEIDICSDDLAARADLLGQPDGHRSPSGADLKASPTRPDQRTPSVRKWVKDPFQKTQPASWRSLGSSR